MQTTPAPGTVADRLRRRSRAPWIIVGAAIAAAALVVGGIAVWNAAAPVEPDGIVVDEFDAAPEIGGWVLELGGLGIDAAGVCEAGQDAALLILHDALGTPAALRLLDTATGESAWETPLPAGLETVECAVASIDRRAAVVSTVDLDRHHGLLGVALEDGAIIEPREPAELLVGAGGPDGVDGDVIVATADGVARLDLVTLDPVWSVDAPGASVSTGPGIVVIGDRVVRFVDGGDAGWSATEGAVATVDGMLLRVDRDGALATVHAVDPRTGRDRWSLDLGAASAIPIPGSGLLLVTGGETEGIDAIRLGDGGREWHRDESLAAEPVLLTGDGSAGYALLPITGEPTLVAVIDLASGQRRFELEVGDPSAPSRIVAMTEQTITIAVDGGGLVAVDAENGDVRWRLDPDPRGGAIVEAGGRFVQLALGSVLGIGSGVGGR